MTANVTSSDGVLAHVASSSHRANKCSTGSGKSTVLDNVHQVIVANVNMLSVKLAGSENKRVSFPSPSLQKSKRPNSV